MNRQELCTTIAAVTIAFLVLGTGVENARAQCQAQQLAEITASDPFNQDFFGNSVDMDGDVAVVGAYGEGALAGAIYVFRFNGTNWIQEAKLIGSDTTSLPRGDQFGFSVSVSGDTIVVGSHYDDFAGKEDAGSAYVFVFDGSRWSQAAKLIASDAAGWDNFGYSVSIDGDVIIVGANLDDDGGANAGTAFIFEKPSGGWTNMTETAKLIALDTYENDEFGKSVSVSGNTAVIGAHYEATGSGFLTGSAYVFQFNGSSWTQVAKLTASDAADFQYLGISVSIDGDVIVGGAWADDAGGEMAGAAYVFEKPTGGWADMTQTAKLTASDAAAGDHFGWSASVDSDYIVIGAPAHNWDGSGYGTAYAFKRPPGGWSNMTENARYNAPGGVRDDQYAISVSANGSRALVGASWHDTLLNDKAGSAYVNGGLADCQPNGVLDICDVVLGTSPDSNGNGVPDECEGLVPVGNIGWSLRARTAEASQITLSWGSSCIGADNDYEVYEGTLGDFESHAAKFCTTGGELQKTFVPAEGNTYYIVVPRNASREGSYGFESDGMERRQAVDACLPSLITDCL